MADDDRAYYMPTEAEIKMATTAIQETWSPISERHARGVRDCDVEAPVPTYKILYGNRQYPRQSG